MLCKDQKVKRKSSLSMAIALCSQNGETNQRVPLTPSPSLGLPFSSPLFPFSLPHLCLVLSRAAGARLHRTTHLSSFCHPWSPSSKSRNLYLGGRGGTSLSKSTILPQRVGNIKHEWRRGGREKENSAE